MGKFLLFFLKPLARKLMFWLDGFSGLPSGELTTEKAAEDTQEVEEESTVLSLSKITQVLPPNRSLLEQPDSSLSYSNEEYEKKGTISQGKTSKPLGSSGMRFKEDSIRQLIDGLTNVTNVEVRS